MLSREVGRWVRSAWAGVGGGALEVTVRLTGDAEVARLNRQFRGRRRATDVLTFAYPEGTARGAVTGDVVIAVGVARRQARARRVTLREELLRLCVHGIAHLAGHDHHTRDEYVAMRQVEAAIVLQRLQRSAKERV